MEQLQTIFDYQVSGLAFPPPDGKDEVPMLICLAGFPDTASVWSALTSHPELQTTHHIIALGLPGMQQDALPLDRKWGHLFDEIVAELHKIVRYCRRVHPNVKIHLCGHDWGALLCYLYLQQNPDLIHKYASLDIGLMEAHEMPLSNTVKCFGYMFLFALVFVLQNLLGAALAVKLLDIYPWGLIGPLNKSETIVFGTRPRQAPHTTYPYFQLLKDTVMKRTMNPVRVHWPNIQKVKQCYLYGTNKNIMYHSSIFLQNLDKTPGCFHKAIEGGGHWFYTESQHSAEVAKILSDFFLAA
jgi:pimeloyl-ACP methyl ester carboxylesterase